MSEYCRNEPDQLPREQVLALYSELALHPSNEFGWGKGRENAAALGYDANWLEYLPGEVWESSAGVGNPFAIGPIHKGETVVDLGCGAGADVCIAALLVGSKGRVIGVDMTPSMAEKARANASLAHLDNVTICEADIAALPIPDECADIVISNGCINLSMRKPSVLKEVFRILKPGRRFYIADMVRAGITSHPESPAKSVGDSWANCVAGTIYPECFLQMLGEAGFINAITIGTTGYRTSEETVGALLRTQKPS